MNHTEIAQRVAEKFKTADGMIVDVLYGTSDGQLFFTPGDASEAAKVMADTVVTPYYRDSAVREMAKQYVELQKMVFLTDYLKRAKLKKLAPSYTDYTDHANEMGMGVVPIHVFEFVVSKVFHYRRPVGVGQKDKIYMYSKGIVEAYFLMRFPQGQIWQVDDGIVFTCPTNTELMSGKYKLLFAPILDPDSQKKQ